MRGAHDGKESLKLSYREVLQNTDSYFTKDDTKALKGIAILLMLMHHLWGFPERLAGEGLKYVLSFNGQSLIGYFGDFGKICVAVFAATVLLRQSVFGADFDLLLVPIFAVVAADMLGRLKALRTVLIYIGRQSTGMWLCHGFFCYYFPAVARLVVSPKWAVPSLLVLVVMSYAASALVYGFGSGGSKLLTSKFSLSQRFSRSKP